MFGKYNDLILMMLILGQLTIICLILSDRSEKSKNKILATTNRTLEKKVALYEFSLPRITMLVDQLVDDVKQRGKQIDQINRYLGEVLEISNLIGFERKEMNADDIIQELKERLKWAEEARKYQISPDYFDPD